MSEANVHVERPVGRYGKTKESPAKYGRVVDVSGCGRYWKFEYGQTRRIARWFAADAIELHQAQTNKPLSYPLILGG